MRWYKCSRTRSPTLLTRVGQPVQVDPRLSSSRLQLTWAYQHRDRIQGIAFMEALAAPSRWAEFPDDVVNLFQGFPSPAGEHMVLEQNLWIDGVLPGLIQRQLSDEEMDYYRQPFASPGEDRRPPRDHPDLAKPDRDNRQRRSAPSGLRAR
jgi:hypothetical protein